MNLKELLKSCKKDDINAQKELYDRYKDVLYILCLKYSRSKEEAEDILHDSFMIIFTSLNKYKGKGSFEGWMKRIVINKAITSFKKASNFNVLLNEEITGEVVIEESSIKSIPLKEILNAIQQLPDRYRMVFNLYEMDGYSHNEISKMLDITVGTSKSNLHRSKILLRKRIKECNNNLNTRSYGN